MKFDESLLSAYLDDEIDPVDRRTVEMVLAADQSSRDRLRSLTTNRDLVGGLTRPSAPCGLASSIVTQIDSSTASHRRRPYYWFATAASILFAIILTFGSGQFTKPAATLALVPPSPVSTEANLNDQAMPIIVAGPDQVPDPPDTAKLMASVGPIHDPMESDRQRLVSMTDRPGTRRILIVTDVIDPAARDRVDTLLREIPRKESEFGRLTIAQGIVIDPQYPNEAEVFPTVMDGPEEEQFLSKIRGEFTTVIAESNTDPTLGTMLAEVGTIHVEMGRSAAGLGEPPAEASSLALRNAHDHSLSHVTPDPLKPNDRPDFRSDLLDKAEAYESVRVGSAMKRAESKGLAPTAPKIRKSDVPVPVLVWVTSHHPARLRD